MAAGAEAQNLGALKVDKNLNGKITAVTAMPSFDLFITCEETQTAKRVIRAMEPKVGRVVINGYPTGVEVNHAIVHGGPYPATTDPGSSRTLT